jgi:4-hydroxybenzoate polyprenyltransferase
MKPWSLFIQERFPLFKHSVSLLCLFLANASIATESFAFKNSFLCFSIVFLTFFRLRIFDEVKDYPTDCVIHPDRPLARGLISVHVAKMTAFAIMGIELSLSLMLGLPAFVGSVLVCAYSLLMYREFFISSWLRPRLTMYALIHTPVCSCIALFIFSSMAEKYVWQAPFSVLLFSFVNWLIFNIFEFGRKTYGQEEEKPLNDSYSKRFGSWGAATLVLLMASLSVLIAWYLGVPALPVSLLFLALMGLSLPYAFFNSKKWAIAFRTACSLFILLFNIVVFLGAIL